MSEVSSGHGGDFELVLDTDGTYKPNLEFTLPKLHRKVRFDHKSAQDATAVLPNIADSRHPNKRLVQPHDSLIKEADHSNGIFKVYHPDQNNPDDNTPTTEKIHFAIKYVKNALSNETIEILGLDDKPVVEFNFNVLQPNTYVVLVIYNFRMLPKEPHPTVSDGELLFSGNPRFLHRPCYVYVVAANNTYSDPQNLPAPQDPPDPLHLTSLPGTSLEINLSNLVALMGGDPATLDYNVKLYHAPASEINNTNLDVNKWNIDVTEVADTGGTRSPQDIIFTVNSGNFSYPDIPPGHIPLGLYIFGLPEALQQIPAPEQPDKVNINTATAEELDTLPGIGPTLANAVIAERTEAPFSHIRDIMRIDGIGLTLFENLKDHITV